MLMLEYLCDGSRHLICRPYSVANLHQMAADLEIGRHWYDPNPRHPHYDIPLRVRPAIMARCTVVRPREIPAIIQAYHDQKENPGAGGSPAPEEKEEGPAQAAALGASEAGGSPAAQKTGCLSSGAGQGCRQCFFGGSCKKEGR